MSIFWTSENYCDGQAPRGTGGVGNSGGGGGRGGGGAAQSAADALDEPALGRPLPDKSFDTLREYGYTGSKEFTRAEALDFAMISDVAWRIVCQVFNGPVDECMPDAWNREGAWEGIKRLAEFTYQLTPVADFIDCASNRGVACGWFAAGFVPGVRVLKGLDNVADAAKVAQAAGTYGTKTARIAEHLKLSDLTAAQRELRGEVVARKSDGTPWDHSLTTLKSMFRGSRGRAFQCRRRSQ